MDNEVILPVYNAHPTAEKFHNSTATVKGIMGPINSGKSVVCCKDVFMKACAVPKCKDGVRRSRWLIARNTYSQLNETTIETWKTWHPEVVFDAPISKAPPYKQTIKFSNPADDYGQVEIKLLFMALDSISTATEKLRSLELTGAWLNEAQYFDYAIFREVLSRTGRYPSTMLLPKGTEYWSGVIMDTNPPSDRSWWYIQMGLPYRKKR